MLTKARCHPARGQLSPARRDLGADVDQYFASLGRDNQEQVQLASRIMLGVPLIQEVINAIPLPVSVLNEKGQVVLTNRRWDSDLDADPDFSHGRRHGELFECLHRHEGPDGCLTSEACADCGAAESIFESLESQEQVTREYQLHRESAAGTHVVERRITATPLHVDGREFTIFVVDECQP